MPISRSQGNSQQLTLMTLFIAFKWSEIKPIVVEIKLSLLSGLSLKYHFHMVVKVNQSIKFFIFLRIGTSIVFWCWYLVRHFFAYITFHFHGFLEKKQFFSSARFCYLNPKSGLPDPQTLGKVSKQHENMAKFDQVCKISMSM